MKLDKAVKTTNSVLWKSAKQIEKLFRKITELRVRTTQICGVICATLHPLFLVPSFVGMAFQTGWGEP